MRKLVVIGVLAPALILLTGVKIAIENTTDPEALAGSWTVDLRPTPDSEPYLQAFELIRTDDGSFEGTFYGTAIENVAINTDWGEATIAFTTVDASGTYHTVARLDGGVLRGTTHSAGRGFLAVWTAQRKTG